MKKMKKKPLAFFTIICIALSCVACSSTGGDVKVNMAESSVKGVGENNIEKVVLTESSAKYVEDDNVEKMVLDEKAKSDMVGTDGHHHIWVKKGEPSGEKVLVAECTLCGRHFRYDAIDPEKSEYILNDIVPDCSARLKAAGSELSGFQMRKVLYTPGSSFWRVRDQARACMPYAVGRSCTTGRFTLPGRRVFTPLLAWLCYRVSVIGLQVTDQYEHLIWSILSI